MMPGDADAFVRERDTLLGKLAAEAGRVPEWSHYAAYCHDRAHGLRRTALEHMRAFVAETDGWDDGARRAFVEWLCVQLEPHLDVAHHATRQRIVERLIHPTLRKWTGTHISDPRPHRWLGMLFAGYRYYRPNAENAAPVNAKEHLRKAIAIDPQEQPSRIRLVELLIDDMVWDTHRLPDYYIGDPEITLEVADEALRVAGGIDDPVERDALEHAVLTAQRLVQDWIDFKEAHGIEFAAWCLDQGRSLEWVRHYYFRGG
jgi:hypothetical protein